MNYHWLNLVLNSDYDSIGSPENAVFVLMTAFAIGQIVAWTYMRTHRLLSYSQTFTASLVVMPVLVSLMMMLMTGSLFVAFGLLAVFAVVRFRNVLKDTRDTSFVMWSIIEGMAIGTGQESTAIIGAVVIAFIMFYLRLTQFGSIQRYDVVLNLLCGSDLNIASILRRHSRKVTLAAQRKVGDGGFDMSYRLLLRDPSRSHDLQSELELAEGIQRVSLFMREDESEV